MWSGEMTVKPGRKEVAVDVIAHAAGLHPALAKGNG